MKDRYFLIAALPWVLMTVFVLVITFGAKLIFRISSFFSRG
jgi:hypothetical protein